MLEINISLLFITLLIWILTYVLNALFFKPVLTVIQQRKQLTEGVKNDAEIVIQEAQQLLDEYQKKIAIAKSEIYELAKQQRNEFLKQKNDALQRAREETAILINNAVQEINASLESAKAHAEQETKTMAYLIARQILHKDSKDTDSKTL